MGHFNQYNAINEYERINNYKSDIQFLNVTDKDITSFQNFLIENDTLTEGIDTSLPYKKQIEQATNIINKHKEAYANQMVLDNIVSRITYSGNKSLHIIITMEKTIKSLDEYHRTFDYLNKYIKEHYNFELDKQCRNPSRLTRKPNMVNSHTRIKQIELYKSDNKCTLDFSKQIEEDIKNDEIKKFIEKQRFEKAKLNANLMTNSQKDKALQTNQRNVTQFINNVVAQGDGYRHNYISEHIGYYLPQMRSLYRAGLFDFKRDFIDVIGFKDQLNNYKKYVENF